MARKAYLGLLKVQSGQCEANSDIIRLYELGRCVGRNPPSVLGDIHLIGIPAPPAGITGAYYPFHGVGGLFHPYRPPHQRKRIILNGGQRFLSVP